MARVVEESGGLDSNTIGIFRSAATVKGGRRFSFGAMVVVGDRGGRVGIGYAKANEVPPAIEKATKDGKKSVRAVTLQGGTIPHEVVGRSGSSSVKLLPASPGTGVVAGSTVRAVLEMAGITDCMTKSYGSTNKKNLAKATLEGLHLLRAKETIGSLRGVEIGETEVDERLARGSAFLATTGASARQDAESEESGGGDRKTDAAKGGGKDEKKDEKRDEVAEPAAASGGEPSAEGGEPEPAG